MRSTISDSVPHVGLKGKRAHLHLGFDQAVANKICDVHAGALGSIRQAHSLLALMRWHKRELELIQIAFGHLEPGTQAFAYLIITQSLRCRIGSRLAAPTRAERASPESCSWQDNSTIQT